MKFKATILQFGNNTGIEVPLVILDELGGGKKPLVVVTINNYSYRSAVGKMGQKFMISLSAENRKNAGVQGGEEHEVDLKLDTEPRIITLPDALLKAFFGHHDEKVNFEKLAPSKKKAIILGINEAKTEETKMRRIAKLLETLNSK